MQTTIKNIREKTRAQPSYNKILIVYITCDLGNVYVFPILLVVSQETCQMCATTMFPHFKEFLCHLPHELETEYEDKNH